MTRASMPINALHTLVMVAITLASCHHSVAFIRHHHLLARRCNPVIIRRLSTTYTFLSVGMETRYQISAYPDKRWIKVSFADADNTTVAFDAKEASKQQEKNPSNLFHSTPESVLQYERQLRKIQASDRASKTNVTAEDHLHVLYTDEHLVVTNKPSGILCVPGVNKYRSLLDLVYESYGGDNFKEIKANNANDDQDESSQLPKDSMIVHRLDMDTSGVVVFARTRLGMANLHKAFRERNETKKMYEALLVGWLNVDDWIAVANNTTDPTSNDQDTSNTTEQTTDLGGGEIHLPLQRDHKHPPFMRISTPESETEAQQAVKDLNHAGWKKIIAKKPKPSTTHFSILAYEKLNGHPVTRVALTPITGRTHQLRVHCAALGHPIVGDPAYGYCGEAHPNGGFSDELIVQMSPTCADMKLRSDVEDTVRHRGRTMCLHARMLGFNHPSTGEAVCFEAAPSF